MLKRVELSVFFLTSGKHTNLLKSSKTLVAVVVATSFMSVAGIATTPYEALAASIHTAWVKKKVGSRVKFFFGTGVSKSAALESARDVCGRSCAKIFVKKGCQRLRLRSGKVLKPKGLCS